MPAFVLPKERQTWLLLGDSVTQAARHTHGCRGYGEIFAERVRWELQRFSDAVINLGVSGSTIRDLSAGYREQLERFRPDVVSLMFGINDAKRGEAGIPAFRDRYREVLRTIKGDVGAQLVVQTPNAVTGEQARSQRSSLPGYVEAIRELALDEDAVLVDNHALWASYDADLLMDDDIHPNARGHAVLARSLLETIGLWDPEGEVARMLEVP
jgi:lysophospholipase L1-like esterase